MTTQPMTDERLAGRAARAARVVDQGMVDDLGDPIACAADVPALLAEVKELRAQRTALAGVLAEVETPEHNAAVLRSGVNVLDYTHGMESIAPAATDETANETARDVVEREHRAFRRGFIAGMMEDGTPTDEELQRRIGQAYPLPTEAASLMEVKRPHADDDADDAERFRWLAARDWWSSRWLRGVVPTSVTDLRRAVDVARGHAEASAAISPAPAPEAPAA